MNRFTLCPSGFRGPLGILSQHPSLHNGEDALFGPVSGDGMDGPCSAFPDCDSVTQKMGGGPHEFEKHFGYRHWSVERSRSDDASGAQRQRRGGADWQAD
jgi:hypothetical protein